ncbi:predicted protein [Arabidopsis lyrata subsp. lyrata]|uniref:Predicted protein n=1 Tax=Arabidopsis lyrata subsp. lyrata TaxID=81972 RepID=D7MVQ7_ARALL|nr:predicted protein [Arabidopsis lyrata subsp. lyrata]
MKRIWPISIRVSTLPRQKILEAIQRMRRLNVDTPTSAREAFRAGGVDLTRGCDWTLLASCGFDGSRREIEINGGENGSVVDPKTVLDDGELPRRKEMSTFTSRTIFLDRTETVDIMRDGSDVFSGQGDWEGEQVYFGGETRDRERVVDHGWFAEAEDGDQAKTTLWSS